MDVYDRIRSKALLSVNDTLANQSEAIQNLNSQYRRDAYSQQQLLQSLDTLFATVAARGKIVVSGIGKSYKIATKLVATLNSLSIHSHVLHPSEALHGDLGVLHEGDCLVLLTASGNTPELLQLLPHVSKSIPIILLTCSKSSKLSAHPQVGSLLYAELPPHLKEDTIHGIPAPTVSTTLSLALADATILALSEMIEADLLKRKKQFSMKHPGGSIGSDLSHLNDNLIKKQDELASIGLQVSSSSLLSLNNIRQLYGRNGASLNSSVTSDDEDSIRLYDVNLSNQIKNSQSYEVARYGYDDFLQIDELNLFKAISLYNYLILESPGKTLVALDTTSIKNTFRSEIGTGYTPEVWTTFVHNITKDFKPIEL